MSRRPIHGTDERARQLIRVSAYETWGGLRFTAVTGIHYRRSMIVFFDNLRGPGDDSAQR